MNKLNEPLTFTVPLSFEAHSIAQRLYRQQSNPQKAKQIYLNTLAVYAVNFYLQCLGIKTDLEQSHSHNPIYLKFMDVADLWVKQLGRLECRPVLPKTTVCQIPSEVESDRIGYVVVEISESLKQATLLGFTPVAVAEVSLNQLRSIAEFPEYLNQIQQASQPTQILVNLSQWFDNIFEAGWQELEALLQPEKLTPAFSMRSTADPFVRRGKLIGFTTQMTQPSVILVVKLIPQSEAEINILVEVYPINGQSYLPEALQVSVLNENGTAVMKAIASNTNQNVQFDFNAEPGERFSVQMILEEISAVENFVV